MPDQTAERPLQTLATPVLYTDIADRRCGRCLQMFPGDATRAPTARPEWWLCESCHDVLIGPEIGRGG